MPKLSYMKALESGYTPQELDDHVKAHPEVQLDKSDMTQNSMLDAPGAMTEHFGQYQPQNEVFSGGVTNGIGVGVPVGTKVAVPSGKWKVMESYSDAVGPGYIGNGENRGYGNSALMQNMDTGEKLRFSHLSHNFTQPGQEIDGNTVIGKTGATGNVTGPHLNLEYYNANGQLDDVMRSNYASSIPITGPSPIEQIAQQQVRQQPMQQQASAPQQTQAGPMSQQYQDIYKQAQGS